MPDLKDGESTEIKGSAAKPYVIRNVGGVYSCTCPAWMNQSHPAPRRTCKHIRKLRGDAAETARLGAPLPQKKASAKKDGPPLLLAESWDNSTDLTDWWMSEKLDGVRAYWDGQRLLSRQGNEFLAPDWFLKTLPSTPLDGELWIDRKKFQRTVSIVRRQDRGPAWKEVRYLVFDAPSEAGPYEARIDFLADLLPDGAEGPVQRLDVVRCQSSDHLRAELARIEELGGEGLMLREPASEYVAGRSSTLLKVKQFHDAEATVVEHSAGKGKHKGRLGALVVRLDDGPLFSVGTGFSDAQRADPPPVGSVITFRYQELSDGGVPRFPSFLRLASLPSAGAPSATVATKKTSTGKKSSGKTSTGKTSTGKKSSGKTTAGKTSTATQAGSASAAQAALVRDGRYFIYQDDKSHKFWQIATDGNDVVVRYGKVGTDGQSKRKALASPSAASAYAEKQIGAKVDKGYEEQDEPHD